MTHKPDRFERMVEKYEDCKGDISSNQVIDLLRQEHAWMKRMVTKIQRWGRDTDAQSYDFERGFETACQMILDTLEARRT